ncbi:dynamin family protein [Paenibacillus chitinolyticus]
MKKLEAVLEECHSILSGSPLRRCDADSRMGLSLQQDTLEAPLNHIHILREKVQGPLKLVLMGEVKAGKSSLLNALAGGRVAPSHIMEMTALVMEVSYDEAPRAEIVRKDGSAQRGSVDEIYDTLAAERGNADFFAECSHVCVRYPLTGLKTLAMVDTPGLNSVTSENHRRTVSYVQEADVVIWVFNANHLGQSDVDESLAATAKTGKKMIGVINRIDEADTTPARLIHYVRMRSGLYLSELFAISARQALEGIEQNSRELHEQSQIQALTDYLDRQVEGRLDAVQRQSIIESALAVLREERGIHLQAGGFLDFMSEQCAKQKRELGYRKSQIMDELKSHMYRWLTEEFLVQETREIAGCIESFGLIDLVKGTGPLEDRIHEIIRKAHIERQISLKVEEWGVWLKEQWMAISEDISCSVDKEFNLFIGRLPVDVPSRSPIGALTEVTAGAGAGFLFGGVTSTVLSLTATTPIVVISPFVIAGAFVGGLISVKRRKHQAVEDTKALVYEIKQGVEENVITELLAQFGKVNDDYERQIAEQMDRQLLTRERERLGEELVAYMESLGQMSNELQQL